MKREPRVTDAPEDHWVKSKSPEIVRDMFTNIAPTYDFLNHLLSLNIDKRWRNFTARRTLSTPGISKILDVCGGTGDMALALDRFARGNGQRPFIVSSDFTPAMMQIAKNKFASTSIVPSVADTTCLPFPSDSFDLVTVAFGIRNVNDTLSGLTEMARVCKPGGQIAVLEFSRTRSRLINGGFSLYFNHILPAIGKLVTKSRAYNYLSKSVDQFPEGHAFCHLMTSASGMPTTATPLSFGIATLYVTTKKVEAPY